MPPGPPRPPHVANQPCLIGLLPSRQAQGLGAGGAPRGPGPCGIVLVHLPVIPCGIRLLAGWRATPGASLGGAGAGGPVPAKGPAGAAVMGTAAWVTSRGGDTRQVRPSAAVRDASRSDRRDPAAMTGGDAGRRG